MSNEKIISLDAEKECDKFQCPFMGLFWFGFFLAALGPTVCRLSLVAISGSSVVAMHRLLAVSSVAEPEL